MEKTLRQYDELVAKCKDLFLKKMQDYGTSWRLMRPTTLTDQLFIKAKRIRTIEENKAQKVADSIEGDFIGIVNYAVMALIQMSLPEDAPLELPGAEARRLYDQNIGDIRSLMMAKNHDYGEAWRDLRTSSITDLILVKLRRIQQIEENEGKTLASEGLEANYQDIANYAIFALILLNKEK